MNGVETKGILLTWKLSYFGLSRSFLFMLVLLAALFFATPRLCVSPSSCSPATRSPKLCDGQLCNCPRYALGFDLGRRLGSMRRGARNLTGTACLRGAYVVGRSLYLDVGASHRAMPVSRWHRRHWRAAGESECAGAWPICPASPTVWDALSDVGALPVCGR